MAPLLGQGYHLFTDNWYTAVPLAESLLLEGTNLTGTVCSNRKYLLAGVKKKLAKGETGWQYEKQIPLYDLARQKTCNFDIYRGIIKSVYVCQ